MHKENISPKPTQEAKTISAGFVKLQTADTKNRQITQKKNLLRRKIQSSENPDIIFHETAATPAFPLTTLSEIKKGALNITDIQYSNFIQFHTPKFKHNFPKFRIFLLRNRRVP